MDMRTLAYFMAIAEEGSFTKAAARCHVAQPSLSQQMRALERELGELLFERGPRATTLTPAGRVLLPYARAAIAAVTSAEEEFAFRAGGLTGDLRIGLVDSIDTEAVAKILATYTTDHPGVALTIAGGTSIELTAQVSEGRLDTAVVALPVAGLPSHLAHREVYREEIVAVERAQPNPYPSALLAAKLTEASIITYNEASGVYPHIKQYFRAHGVDPTIICSTNDPALHRALARQGIGTAITATPNIESLDTSGVTIAKLEPPLQLIKALIWRRSTHSRTLTTLLSLWP